MEIIAVVSIVFVAACIWAVVHSRRKLAYIGASLYTAFAPELARALLGTLEFVYTLKAGQWAHWPEGEFGKSANRASLTA